jgi:hypothetical protein
MLQKQIGECRTHGRLLCRWSNCHSISRIWRANQQCLQGGYRMPVTIGDILHCTCSNFVKILFESLEKERKWMYCKHLHYVFRIMCKVRQVHPQFNILLQ